MRKYISESGDTWDYISFKLYGDETKANDLVKANLAHVETVIFSSGIELDVPELPIESDIDSLPPWKRGK